MSTQQNKKVVLRWREEVIGSSLIIVLVVLILGVTASSARADNPPPVPLTHQPINSIEYLLQLQGAGAVAPGSTNRNAPSPICTTPTSSAADVNTDCEGNNPHAETSIAVNPTNPLNLIGSSNDYQFTLTSGGYLYLTGYSRAHVSFDGGKTWTMYPINSNYCGGTGDSSVAFDAAGTAYIATNCTRISQALVSHSYGDIVATHSSDGGKTWSTPTRVVAGTGWFGSVGLWNDKAYLTAWGSGNAIVTWTEFNFGIQGSYSSSPIFASVTHDGGKTWSTPTEISGSAAFCIGAQGGTKCDQSLFAVPTVAADGSVYVAFENTASLTSGRDQYLVVKVDPNTGTRVAGPYLVSGIYDGFTDYPISSYGDRTYHDSQFRTWSAGNMAADPTNASHLAVIWSDMRNSTLPAPANPYVATTNSDLVVSQSFNGGATWSAPVAINVSGDQFMPWGAYDTNGLLRIGYFDRSYDPANHAYGYTLATETARGSLSFSSAQLTTALSDPTQGTLWFSWRTPNPAFPHPSAFLGDYSGIAVSPSGAAALWADMRLTTCFGVSCGKSEDAFYASAP
jgi:hypothetical protein